MNDVILVDSSDRKIGTMEKLTAHKKGLLHRAISVHITTSSGKILLQRRAASKYHSPLLLSNACCSHPYDEESPLKSAQRRLLEELGFACSLTFQTSFMYKKDVGNGLIEHELDHVFHGIYDGPVHPNPDEVCEIIYVTDSWIQTNLKENPSLFTSWFPLIYHNFFTHK